MFGTTVNAIAIVAGGLVGLLLKKGIRPAFSLSINKALGLAVLILGFNDVIGSMFTAEGGKLASSGEMLLIISLVVGVFAGEMLGIDAKLSGISEKIEHRFKLSGFAASFVNGTLIYCVGAMAIIGALNDGLSGDSSVLLIKSMLDGISSIILGATLGGGVIFAAVPVFLYQGAIALLAAEPGLAFLGGRAPAGVLRHCDAGAAGHARRAGRAAAAAGVPGHRPLSGRQPDATPFAGSRTG